MARRGGLHSPPHRCAVPEDAGGEPPSKTLRVPKTSSVLVSAMITQAKSPTRSPAVRLEAAVIYVEHCARMNRCAVSTGLPRRRQHPRTATAAADERLDQRCRDPGAAASDHRPRTTTARRESPLDLG